jgi:hypothetical protein
VLAYEREQQMLGLDGLLAVLLRRLGCVLQRFLCLLGESIQTHVQQLGSLSA